MYICVCVLIPTIIKYNVYYCFIMLIIALYCLLCYYFINFKMFIIIVL